MLRKKRPRAYADLVTAVAEAKLGQNLHVLKSALASGKEWSRSSELLLQGEETKLEKKQEIDKPIKSCERPSEKRKRPSLKQRRTNLTSFSVTSNLATMAHNEDGFEDDRETQNSGKMFSF